MCMMQSGQYSTIVRNDVLYSVQLVDTVQGLVRNELITVQYIDVSVQPLDQVRKPLSEVMQYSKVSSSDYR